jgi:hypothetical protein
MVRINPLSDRLNLYIVNGQGALHQILVFSMFWESTHMTRWGAPYELSANLSCRLQPSFLYMQEWSSLLSYLPSFFDLRALVYLFIPALKVMYFTCRF